MRIARLSMLLGLPLLLSACGGGEAETETETVEAEPAATPEAPGAAAPAGPPMTGTVTLQPLQGSTMGGEATLTEVSGQTEVMVRLTGSEPRAVHQGHIHQGTCEAPGTVVAPLTAVETGSGGDGTSTTTAAVPIMNVMNGQHIIVFHVADGSPGRPVVCGAVPGHSM